MFADLNLRTIQAAPNYPSFEERLGHMRAGTRRIAFFYDQPDDSTFRYRVANMIAALEPTQDGAPRSESVGAAWFCQDDRPVWHRVAQSCDVLVLARVRYSDEVAILVEIARAHGAEIIYDVDDFVIDVREVPCVLHTLNEDQRAQNVVDYWFAYFGRLQLALELCDRVVVTNEHLAARVEASSGKPVAIVPNFMNEAQLRVSDVASTLRHYRSRKPDEAVHLGYFSGSPSHNRDFALVADQIADLMETDENIHLRVGGYLEIGGKLANLADRIERLPMLHHTDLQIEFAKTEINLVPLQNNQFTRCKSELKYFEAAASGCPSIASRVGTLQDSIQDGKTGWLVRQTQWMDRIRDVVDLVRSGDDQFSQVCRSARRDALARFSVEANRERVRDMYLNGRSATPAETLEFPTVSRLRRKLAEAHPTKHDLKSKMTA